MEERDMETALQNFFSGEKSTDHYLGCGGFGSVYSLGNGIAIKVIEFGKAEFATPVTEQKKLSSLIPAAVNMFHVGEHGDSSFIVMEQLQGCTLNDLIPVYKTLSQETRYRIAADVLETGCQFWDARVSHGDMKPRNGMLDHSGCVRVIDFDNACQFLSHEDVKKFANRAGVTPLYVAPETIRDNVYGRGSDTYSVGASLFELETGITLIKAATEGTATSILKITQFYQAQHAYMQKALHCTVKKFISDTRMQPVILEMLTADPVKRPRPQDLRHHLWRYAADGEDVAREVAQKFPAYARAIRSENA